MYPRKSIWTTTFFLYQNKKEKIYIHDNLDFSKNKQVWHYAFHGDTLPINDVEKLGVAANDRFGNIHIKRLKFRERKAP